MGAHVAHEMIKVMARKGIHVGRARGLVMGLAFKENCPDIRNTRVTDVIAALDEYGVTVDVVDPWVNTDEARNEYGLELVSDPKPDVYDGLVVAVAHKEFRALSAEALRAPLKDVAVIYDVKSMLPAGAEDVVRL